MAGLRSVGTEETIIKLLLKLLNEPREIVVVVDDVHSI